jgi:hypothetical protein
MVYGERTNETAADIAADGRSLVEVKLTSDT